MPKKKTFSVVTHFLMVQVEEENSMCEDKDHDGFELAATDRPGFILGQVQRGTSRLNMPRPPGIKPSV